MPEDALTTILVADDEPLVIGVVATALEMAGFRVLKARDGAEALRLCQADGARIDAAVLDYFMPGMEGSDLFHRLRELHPRIKIIVMSGYTDQLLETLRADSSSPHVDGVLSKPFLPSQLVAKVRQSLVRTAEAPGGA